MQTTAKATRKEIKQIITLYQSILEFSAEKLWVEVIIKHNKSDPDNLIDDLNAKLIDVCWEYLEWKSIGWDKYQLSTVVMDLYTQTIASLDEPFKVILKENKTLIQEYLEKNKQKREALDRIKRENESMDKELAELKTKLVKKNLELSAKRNNVEYVEEEKPALHIQEEAKNTTPKKKKQANKYTGNVYDLVDEWFKLPII